jgi:hypothetical protein
MSRLHGFRGSHPLLISLHIIATFALAGCANISGNDEAAASFGIDISSMYLTLENRTGTALIDGRIEIIPPGRTVVFTTAWPRMEIGEKRDFMLNVFRGSDGTPFRRGVIRARRVKVTASDLAGKIYEREVPFH